MTKINEAASEMLALLEGDCRLSNSEIARRLGVSESYVRQTLKRVFDTDHVRRGVVVDFNVLGIKVVACLRMRFEAEHVNAAIDRLADEPSMGLVMNVTGAFDIFGMVTLRSTSELAHFLEEKVRSLSGFLSVDVSIVTDAVKYDSRQAPFRLIDRNN